MRREPGPSPVAPFFAALLSLSTGNRHPPLALSPQKQKEKTIEARSSTSSSRPRRPVLCLFEDLQWADPSTLGARPGRRPDPVAPFLLLATARPDFMLRWRDRPHAAAHSLARLTPRHSEG